MLALLGLTGAILIHKHAWIGLPHAGDPLVTSVSAVAATLTRVAAEAPSPLASVLFATEGFGLHELRFADGTGAYADQTGTIVTRWASQWERPEIWLFDLHHHLFVGHTGELIAGFLGLCGLCFVVTGAILWWRQRKTFAFRLIPARLSRPAVVRHHRDLGVVVAPLLVVSMLTGTMLNLRPVADFFFEPWSDGISIEQALQPPMAKGGALVGQPDWTALLQSARTRFPETEFRVLSLPRAPGDLIGLRTKQPQEWLPNGRSTFWFDPADSRVVEARDALTLPTGIRGFNLVYPLHSAKVGGLPYRLLMTCSGLGLVLLGTLTVWTFWFRRPQQRKAPQP